MRDPSQQLTLLSQQSQLLVPALYRDLALYLQILRGDLLTSTRQAVLHLLRHHAPTAYLAGQEPRRLAFHGFLSQATQCCCTLLTVEQLLALARAVERERRAQWVLQTQQTISQSESAFSSGSVELSMRPPIGGPWMGSVTTGEQPNQHSRSVEYPMLDALQQLNGQQEDALILGPSAQETQVAQSSPSSQLNLEEPFSLVSETGDHLFPREPHKLLQCWDRLEEGLARRLRNLSHAINAELMRCRFSTRLLPLPLLQAVLDGQVDTQPAPANLVTLAVPVPSPHGSAVLETHAVLLRCSDLEESLPRLKQWRRRLDERRQQLQRMARQHRYWSDRAQSMEVEQAWTRDMGKATALP